MEKLLKELCQINGVSGNEENICNFIREKVSTFSETIVENNSIIASIGPSNAKKHILFEAHIDHIGLIVTSIEKNGFLRFSQCGGIDPRVLYGNSVCIHGKQDIIGVICSTPPHLKNKNTPLEIDDMLIDTGMSDEIVKKMISVGDVASFSNGFYRLANNNIASKSTDNRAGVCILIKLLEKLSKQHLDIKFSILLTSREEIGCMGAKVASYRCSPDEAISVDVSFGQQPGITDNKYGNLNAGPLICISPVLSKKICNNIIKIAQQFNIPYQLEVYGGKSGTTADVISLTKGGIPCGLVSIPQRYMHTGVEIVNLNDMESILELLFNYAMQGGTY